MRKVWTIFAFLFYSTILSAQDFSFSQFAEQPLLRNPALAGLYQGDLRVSMVYRNQWSSITVPFRTTALSIEYKTPVGKSDDFITWGGQMSMDGAGDIRLRRTQFLPAINYHKSLSQSSDTYLSVAFMGGPVSSQFDPTQFKFGDQFRNGSTNNASQQIIGGTGYGYWDFSTGITFLTTLSEQLRCYAGLSLLHANRPRIKSVTGQTDANIAPRWNTQAGIQGKANNRDYIAAHLDILSQEGNRQYLLGLKYGWGTIADGDNVSPSIFYVGCWYRYGDALIPVVEIQHRDWHWGISYDINLSRLRTASNGRGGLELSLGYTGFLKIRSSTLDKIRCARL
jgi:type IX secretion system PorP/SprF family membrane protein